MKEKYIDIFHKNRTQFEEHSASILNQEREYNINLFQELGFPTNDLEEYKYTDFTQALKKEYAIQSNEIKMELDDHSVEKSVSKTVSYRFFMLNEKYYSSDANNQNLEILPDGVIIENLKVAVEKYPDLVAKYYAQLSNKQSDGFVALNGVFSQDGLFVYIPKNTQLKYPIELVNLLHSDTNLMVNTRNLIVIEAGAKVQFIQTDFTQDNSPYFINRLTEIFVGENAFCENYSLEKVNRNTANTSTLLVRQEASSNLSGNIITLNNGQTRNSVEVDLKGENCETHVSGMFVGNEKQSIDNYTSINHNVPHCESNELFKHVLDDYAQSGFTGRLCVAQDAQKTEAYQTNKNIVLSDNAKAQTRPQLEIFADDVKCSHGATIGQIDDNALFYMQSRGIPRSEAKMLLTNAFMADVIDKIKIESLKAAIKELVAQRLIKD